MATASCSRSGGEKIVSNRRKNRQAAGPYDRSSPPPPNWLADAILHPALTLASGAGKILSSVLLSDSSSSEDVDSASENDVGDDNDYEIASDEIDKLSRKNGTSLQMIKDRQGSQARKSIIERLIMQETFSREECDRLINVVNSRVMGYSTIEAGVNGLHTDALRDIVGDETVGLYIEDVVEAKIWFEEQKMGLNAGSNLAHGTCGLNSSVVQPIESEVGPPVDMAKSHMNVHPPWARPSKHTELRTPSTMAIEPFKEGTLYSSGNDYLSSKKQDSLSSGSWNIQEKLRRVHLKATEAMNWLSSNQRRWNVSDKVNKENKRAAELKLERELKRLKSSINYNGRNEQGKKTVNPSTV